MIRVTVYQDASGRNSGFRMEGHAQFAQYGKDIVCAAVSMLVINTMNSIEHFTEETFLQNVHREKDVVSFEITSRPIGHDAELLLNSMVMGLEAVAREYGKKYIRLKIERE